MLSSAMCQIHSLESTILWGLQHAAQCTSCVAPPHSGYRSQLPSRAALRHTQRCAASARSGGDEPSVIAPRRLDGLADVAQRLSAAVDAEDYEKAAALRDELNRRQADGQEAVQEANRLFYEAFQTRDLKAMAAIWGEGDHVQCIHPISSCIAGRADVLASWKTVLGTTGSLNIRVVNPRVVLLGESQAFVTCTEMMDAGDTRGRIVATNVFEKQGNTWRMVHHHGSPQPADVALTD